MFRDVVTQQCFTKPFLFATICQFCTVLCEVKYSLTVRSADMFAVIGRGLFYEVSPTRFGTLGKALFTLFQLITLDDWFYMYSDVVAKSPGGYRLNFVLLLLILFGLSFEVCGNFNLFSFIAFWKPK